MPRRPTSADELARKGEPITDASIFELYSCTKLVTAITALQLVEQGRIGLDDIASDFVPALGQVKLFRRFDAEGELVLEENVVPITVRMLLTHTAGTAKASSLPPSPAGPDPWPLRIRLLHTQPRRDSDRGQARDPTDALLVCS